jgi:HK97 family phage major capsid protein
MDVKELKRLRAAKLAEGTALVDAAKTAARGLTDAEQTTFEGIVSEVEKLDRQIDVAVRFAAASSFDAGGSRVSSPLAHNDPANTGTRHSYSILKAIRQSSKKGERVDGIELEVHTDLAKRKMENGGAAPQGFMVPYDLPVNLRAAGAFARSFAFTSESTDLQRRAMDSTAGAGSIVTILDATMIDLLRVRMITASMGATVLTDMTGPFAIPRQNAASTLYWVAENGPITDSNATIDQVLFAPKTAGAQMTYSRRFAEQTNQDAEMFVRNDITKVVSIGFDYAGLNGLGSGNQPLGIQQNPAITTIAAGTNGAAPIWGNFVDLESAVATANADLGRLGYVLNAKLRGTLKKTVQVGTFPVFIWDTRAGDTPLNGYRVGVTNQLPSNLVKGTSGAICTSCLFGNWEDLVFALWSGLDVVVDPYTGASAGAVKIVCLQDADVNVRHPESFSKIVDLIP